MEIIVIFANKLLNWKIKYLQIYFLWDIVHVTTFLTVVTILFTAAADRSSPLGWSTRVMPRWRRLKVMPSKIVSRVSVQFSGSSGDKWKRTNSVCINLFNQSCVAGLKPFYSWCSIVSRSKVLVFQSNHFNSKTIKMSIRRSEYTWNLIHHDKTKACFSQISVPNSF